MRAVLLLAFAGWLCGAVCGSVRAGENGTAAVIVADFEQPSERFLVTTRKRAAISDQVSSRGRRSLRIQVGDYINLRTRRLAAGRPGDLLRIDLFNGGRHPLSVRAEIFDVTSSKGYWYRHVRRYMLRPGWNTLPFRVARLYRGEKNSRRIADSYLDPAKINRVDLAFDSNEEPGFIYIDNIRFEPDPGMPAVKGLRAFDFGPENQAIRPGFTSSSREVYEAARGHGWSGAGWPNAVRDYVHPNDLLADFREARGETFSVRVPNGVYHVRVYYEDHGWWKDQFARFNWRTIKAEGNVVHEERLTREQAAKRFYRFADLEPWPGIDVYDVYIRNGLYRPKEFDVAVKDGKFDLRFDADKPMVCRISAIVLWPTSEAGAAAKWCAELDKRMHKEFDAENVYVDTGPRGRRMSDIPKAAQKDGIVLFSARGAAATGPSYVPAREDLTSGLTLFCAPGEDTGASFSLRTVGEGGPVKIAAAIPGLPLTVFVVQNRLRRHKGGYTIEPDILRPLGDLKLAADRTRQFWLEINVPADAKPGKRAGELRIEFRGRKRTLPVIVEVLPIRLSEPKMAFGLFGLLPDSYAPPGALQKVVELLKRHGMSSAAGVPLGRVRAEKGAIKVDFSRADEVMSALKKAGFKLPVDTYGGGGFGGTAAAAKALNIPYEDALRRALNQIREHAKTANWLPVYYSMVDEPHWSNEAVARATKKVQAVRAAAPWLPVNGYWSPRANNAYHQKLMDALSRTTLGRATPLNVGYLKAKGKSIGFYGGCSRHEFGFKQWAAASRGFGAHYAWHLYIRYGDLYYDLDAREPDVCMVYYTPTEVRPSLRLKTVRAGIYDYLYLQTLADLEGGSPGREAKRILDRAKWAGNIYRERSAPKIAEPDVFRRQVADAILKHLQGGN